MTDQYFNANRKMWDEFAKENFKVENEYYSVKKFLEGNSSLKTFELEEVGIIKGKKLLHLQCHFGLDTLSWSREGAIVTGIDFSGEAIRLARKLAESAELQANFIESNIYNLRGVMFDKFDIIYTSHGVLCWLNDLKTWGEIISHFLKPGGFFYIAESHPFSQMFDHENPVELQLKNNYFPAAEPTEYTAEGSYASFERHMEPHKEYEWEHSLSEIINSLTQAGLRIEFFNEYPFKTFKTYEFSELDSKGYYRLKNQKAEIPLMFTLKASKDL